jgi:hypothetical protein
LALAATVLALATDARAHSPYFTAVENVVLPSGEPGEIRLLHGDGIFLRDPVRAIAVDSRGHLLARTPRGGAMSIICRQAPCWVYGSLQVFEIDPGTFRSGPPVVGDDAEARKHIWEAEHGEESWGFRVRAPSLGEALLAESLHARHFWRSALLMMALGFVGGAMLVSGNRLPRRRESWVMALWLASIVVRIGAAACAFLVALYWLFLIDLSEILWLASMGFGVAAAVLAVRHVRKRRLTPVS